MEETTATEKEVLRSLLSMERGDMSMNEVNRSQAQQQQHQQTMHHHYAQAVEEPHNLSTSQHQQSSQQQPQQAAQQPAQQQQAQLTIASVESVEMASHHHHEQQQRQQQQQQQAQMAIAAVESSETATHHHHLQQQQQQQQHHPGHHAVEQHQQHAIQPQQGIYKPSTSQHDPTLHGHVQWMAQTPTSGHQVIILHAPPEQQHGEGAGSTMSGLIQAAEQGQLVGQQVWETHVADYPAGVQLSDGTIIPAHPDYQQHGGQAALHSQQQPQPQPQPQQQPGYVLVDAKPQTAPATGPAKERQAKPAKKKKRKLADMLAQGIDPSKLEESADEVRARFEKGCDCAEENCFKTLNSEFVYRHRLNIAELSKHEHDMYLMGVTMACLANPDETARHKERKRLRAKYVFQGKEVCLDAFLYLENCTHYQLKRIRKHVITHGVTPRVHGNHGKRPHNTFPLDIYKHASDFLSDYLDKLTHKPEGKKTTKAAQNRRQSIYLPQDVTRKQIHEKYVDFINRFEPEAKVMSYSAFRYFLKEQFSHVRFPKLEKAAVSEPGVKQETAVVLPAAPPSIDLDEGHQVVTTLLPAEGETSVPFTVPEHHQTTTYTVTSRPPYTSNSQMHYTATNYQYSIAM